MISLSGVWPQPTAYGRKNSQKRGAVPRVFVKHRKDIEFFFVEGFCFGNPRLQLIKSASFLPNTLVSWCLSSPFKWRLIYVQGIHYCLWVRNPANHPTSMKPCKWWDIYHINWCRISSINSISLWFLNPSPVQPTTTPTPQTDVKRPPVGARHLAHHQSLEGRIFVPDFSLKPKA